MDEIWERAVETALDGETNPASARTLTLDSAVKCLHGRLPAPNLLEKFRSLEHLSIANIGVSSLEQFPRLPNLQKLILSDNRIAGGLEHLVEAGLESLRDLDLSNNRIQEIDDLAPLAQLRLVSLDLYECPVTRVKDYRTRVFGLIRSLRYLDKMDSEGNERPESDDEEEEEEEDEEDDDPGSGEIDGEDRPFRMSNGHTSGVEGIVDVDEDESDADEEEAETSRRRENGLHNRANGFRVSAAGEVGDEEEDDGEDDENESGEEIDEDEGEDDDVVEVHEIGNSDDDDDGDEDEDEEDDDEEDEVEEVDNEEGDLAEAPSTGRLTSTEGEIDGHEQGEEDDEDDDGETGEEEQGVEEEGEFEDEDEGEEDEDCGAGYLVQPVRQAEPQAAIEGGDGSDMDQGNEEDDDDGEEDEVEDEDDDDLGEVQVLPSSSSPHPKRKRDDGDDDDDDSSDEDEDEDDRRALKKHR